MEKFCLICQALLIFIVVEMPFHFIQASVCWKLKF